MDDVLVASEKDAMAIITELKKALRSMSFEVSDKKISDIDREAETDFLGLTIVNHDQAKFYTISEKKDAKWKEVLKKVYDSTDITYQTLLSCIGSIPKYNVYSPWLSTLSNKIQSVASREKSQVQADWSDVVSPPLRNLIRRWIVFAIDNKPLKVPLYIYPDSKLTVFVDASKWAMGFVVYQRHGDSDVIFGRKDPPWQEGQLRALERARDRLVNPRRWALLDQREEADKKAILKRRVDKYGAHFATVTKAAAADASAS
ncbi:hypothetical protein FOZ60_015868 [Perkinsus olseni]|uniref:Uncharacterized protein n=1 Tax=Perkinsus olseni TaxID=32597 RepID=A0A7J6N557_PEROL|nr:hypothetical protein FOZ60_015868 [Perkinsus olseni]